MHACRKDTFLLGSRSGSKVSRYERFARRPTLQTAFAYEAVFHVPARELFAGIYQGVERETLSRARVLSRRLAKRKPDRLTAHKLAGLREAARRHTQPQ